MLDHYNIDSHKLVYHPHRVYQWLRCENNWENVKTIYPIYVEISPSGICNHRCTFCAFDYIGYSKRFLSLDILKSNIPEMAQLGVKSILCSGEGEPILNKDIIPITRLIASSGIDVAFASNAVLMNQKFVEEALPDICWFKASIAAGTPEKYALIHRTREEDFHKVIKNLKFSVRYRDQNQLKCTLGAQILLLPDNAMDINTLTKICRDEIGLDYLVVKPFSQHSYSISTMYDKIDYEKLSRENILKTDPSTENFKMIWREQSIYKADKDKLYDTCYAVPFFYAHITASGDVYGCSSFIGNNGHCFGNINSYTFKNLWVGEKRRKNIEHMMHCMNISTCRNNCRMDKINQYLHDLKNPVPHVNFI